MGRRGRTRRSSPPPQGGERGSSSSSWRQKILNKIPKFGKHKQKREKSPLSLQHQQQKDEKVQDVLLPARPPSPSTSPTTNTSRFSTSHDDSFQSSMSSLFGLNPIHNQDSFLGSSRASLTLEPPQPTRRLSEIEECSIPAPSSESPPSDETKEELFVQDEEFPPDTWSPLRDNEATRSSSRRRSRKNEQIRQALASTSVSLDDKDFMTPPFVSSKRPSRRRTEKRRSSSDAKSPSARKSGGRTKPSNSKSPARSTSSSKRSHGGETKKPASKKKSARRSHSEKNLRKRSSSKKDIETKPSSLHDHFASDEALRQAVETVAAKEAPHPKGVGSFDTSSLPSLVTATTPPAVARPIAAPKQRSPPYRRRASTGWRQDERVRLEERHPYGRNWSFDDLPIPMGTKSSPLPSGKRVTPPFLEESEKVDSQKKIAAKFPILVPVVDASPQFSGTGSPLMEGSNPDSAQTKTSRSVEISPITPPNELWGDTWEDDMPFLQDPFMLTTPEQDKPTVRTLSDMEGLRLRAGSMGKNSAFEPPAERATMGERRKSFDDLSRNPIPKLVLSGAADSAPFLLQRRDMEQTEPDPVQPRRRHNSTSRLLELEAGGWRNTYPPPNVDPGTPDVSPTSPWLRMKVMQAMSAQTLPAIPAHGGEDVPVVEESMTSLSLGDLDQQQQRQPSPMPDISSNALEEMDALRRLFRHEMGDLMHQIIPPIIAGRSPAEQAYLRDFLTQDMVELIRESFVPRSSSRASTNPESHDMSSTNS